MELATAIYAESTWWIGSLISFASRPG